MIEDIEELCLQPDGEFFAKTDSFCQIHVGPEESRTTKLVPAGVAKLAMGRTVPPETCARARIHWGDAGAVVATEVSGQRRENPSGRKLQEPAIRDLCPGSGSKCS